MSAVALRERASYAHGPGTAQRDLARCHHLDVGHRRPRYLPRGEAARGIGAARPRLRAVVPSLFEPLTIGAVRTDNRVLMAVR